MLPSLVLAVSLAALTPSPRPSPPASSGEREDGRDALTVPPPAHAWTRADQLTPPLRAHGWATGDDLAARRASVDTLPLPAHAWARADRLTLPLPAERGEGRGGGRLAMRALHQEDDYDEPQEDEDDRPRRHLLISGWGGEALARGGSGRASSFYGGEVAWAFSQLDVGLQAAWYRSLRDATRAWTPVLLTRVTQRFVTRRGFEAAFSIGLGAGRPSGWIGWYQVALGMRLPLGPLFLGAELAFEQYDIIRLAGGVGVAF